MFQFPKRHSILATVALLTAVSLAPKTMAKETTIQMPLAADATTMGIKSSTGGVISIAAMVANVEGHTMVCGFWRVTQRISATSKSMRSFRKGLQSTSVRFKNKTLIQDLTFINEVSEEEYATGTKANCKRSKRKWNPAMTNKLIKIHVPRRTIID